MSQIDKLFELNQVGYGGFIFDESVAAVFDDMIARSVPLYADVQQSIPALVSMVEHDPVRVIDLGCSTGTSLIHLATQLPDIPLQLTGVDASAAMLEKCHEKLEQFGIAQKTTLVEADIADFEFNTTEPPSVVLMNYTLQFIPADSRLEIMRRIRQSIQPGGFLLLSEKFSHTNPKLDQQFVELYCQYKKQNGYSELEISRKRDALENVLIPHTVAENEALLRSAGFNNIELLLKWFNFGTFVAWV